MDGTSIHDLSCAIPGIFYIAGLTRSFRKRHKSQNQIHCLAGETYCALRRSVNHGRHRTDRLHANPGLGMPDHSDVGASAGPGEGEADDVHR